MVSSPVQVRPCGLRAEVGTTKLCVAEGRLTVSMNDGVSTMRGDVHDQKVVEAMAGLPCRGEDGDDRRGYVGWGPHEDAAKTVTHEDWPAYLAGMANTDRYVLDFYFGRSHPSEPW